MELGGGKTLIGKVEKGYEIVSQAHNLGVQLKGNSWRDTQAHNFFCTFVRESYYEGKQHKFMSLTKPDVAKDFAFLIFFSKEARDATLKYWLFFQHEKIQVSITMHPQNYALALPWFLANILPQKDTQTSIVIVF